MLNSTCRFTALLALLVLGCAPQRIYSVNPVDKAGRPLPLDHALGLEFETGEVTILQRGESLTVADGNFEIVEPREDREGPTRWPVSQVARLGWRTPDGMQEWIDVLSPDDLQGFDPIPRIYQIETTDGVVLDLTDTGYRPDWSPGGLELELYDDSELVRSIPLEDIRTVTLYDPSLVDSTLKSPAFWVAGAAATGLFLWISDNADDRDNATK
jgi:hypothetical protein